MAVGEALEQLANEAEAREAAREAAKRAVVPTDEDDAVLARARAASAQAKAAKEAAAKELESKEAAKAKLMSSLFGDESQSSLGMGRSVAPTKGKGLFDSDSDDE